MRRTRKKRSDSPGGAEGTGGEAGGTAQHVAAAPVPRLLSSTEAAAVIQAYWRGHALRQRLAAQYPKRRKRFEIVKEIWETEKNYVGFLKVIVHEFYRPIAKAIAAKQVPLSMEQLRTIFCNADALMKYHQIFLGAISERLIQPPFKGDKTIGDCMLVMAPHLKAYSDYINNFNDAVHALGIATKSSKFATLLDSLEGKQGKDIISFLIMPVQRIPRYVMLLETLIKKTPDDHPDMEKLKQALEQMDTVAQYLNEKNRIAENVAKCWEVFSKLRGAVFEHLVSGDRELLADGPLLEDTHHKAYSSADFKADQTYYYLFNDLLVYTRRPEGRRGNEVLASEFLKLGMVAHLEATEYVSNRFALTFPRGTHSVRAPDKQGKLEFYAALRLSVPYVGTDPLQVRWSSLACRGEAPGRWGHASCTSTTGSSPSSSSLGGASSSGTGGSGGGGEGEGGMLWVVGGHDGTNRKSDVWTLDLAGAGSRGGGSAGSSTGSPTWSRVNASGEAPLTLTGHTATMVGNKRIFVFGGYSGSKWSSSVSVLDITNLKWSSHVELRNSPSARQGHSAVQWKKYVVVFGGTARNATLNDVHALDTDSLKWKELIPKGKPPKTRYGHACCLVGDYMWVLGGRSAFNVFQDVHVLDLANLYWSEPDPELFRKVPFKGFAGCIAPLDGASHRLVVTGGNNGDLSSNRTYVLDLRRAQWTRVQHMGDVSPPRMYHTASSLGGRVYVFGGTSKVGAGGTGAAFTDTYVLEHVQQSDGVAPTEAARRLRMTLLSPAERVEQEKLEMLAARSDGGGSSRGSEDGSERSERGESSGGNGGEPGGSGGTERGGGGAERPHSPLLQRTSSSIPRHRSAIDVGVSASPSSSSSFVGTTVGGSAVGSSTGASTSTSTSGGSSWRSRPRSQSPSALLVAGVGDAPSGPRTTPGGASSASWAGRPRSMVLPRAATMSAISANAVGSGGGSGGGSERARRPAAPRSPSAATTDAGERLDRVQRELAQLRVAQAELGTSQLEEAERQARVGAAAERQRKERERLERESERLRVEKERADRETRAAELRDQRAARERERLEREEAREKERALRAAREADRERERAERAAAVEREREERERERAERERERKERDRERELDREKERAERARQREDEVHANIAKEKAEREAALARERAEREALAERERAERAATLAREQREREEREQLLAREAEERKQREELLKQEREERLRRENEQAAAAAASAAVEEAAVEPSSGAAGSSDATLPALAISAATMTASADAGGGGSSLHTLDRSLDLLASLASTDASSSDAHTDTDTAAAAAPPGSPAAPAAAAMGGFMEPPTSKAALRKARKAGAAHSLSLGSGAGSPQPARVVRSVDLMSGAGGVARILKRKGMMKSGSFQFSASTIDVVAQRKEELRARYPFPCASGAVAEASFALELKQDEHHPPIDGVVLPRLPADVPLLSPSVIAAYTHVHRPAAASGGSEGSGATERKLCSYPTRRDLLRSGGDVPDFSGSPASPHSPSLFSSSTSATASGGTAAGGSRVRRSSSGSSRTAALAAAGLVSVADAQLPRCLFAPPPFTRSPGLFGELFGLDGAAAAPTLQGGALPVPRAYLGSLQYTLEGLIAQLERMLATVGRAARGQELVVADKVIHVKVYMPAETRILHTSKLACRTLFDLLRLLLLGIPSILETERNKGRPLPKSVKPDEDADMLRAGPSARRGSMRFSAASGPGAAMGRRGELKEVLVFFDCLQYRDGDGELLQLQSDENWVDCVKDMEYHRSPFVRLYLRPAGPAVSVRVTAMSGVGGPAESKSRAKTQHVIEFAKHAEFLSFETVRSRAAHAFKFNPLFVLLQYRDEEGNEVILKTQRDWDFARLSVLDAELQPLTLSGTTSLYPLELEIASH